MLIPEGSTYYHYDGGLTTPPCSEVVWWNLADKPVSITPAQYSQLVQQILYYTDVDTCEHGTNAGKAGSTSRPTQPLNGRSVERICPNKGFVMEETTAPTTSAAPSSAPTVCSSTPHRIAATAVEASSQESKHLKAKIAIDGDNSLTRWGSDFSNNDQWIALDLGARTSISSVKLYWEKAYSVEYVLEISDDSLSESGTWNGVHSESAGTGGEETIPLNGEVARYVRLYSSVKHSKSYGISLYEIEVNGIQNPACF
jgi:hypothetical protein